MAYLKSVAEELQMTKMFGLDYKINVCFFGISGQNITLQSPKLLKVCEKMFLAVWFILSALALSNAHVGGLSKICTV